MATDTAPNEEIGVDDAIASIELGLASLAAAGWWRETGERIGALIQRLHNIGNRVDAVGTALVAEGVSRGLPAEAGAKTGAAWLRGLVPLTPYAAHARGALAERMGDPELAPTRASFVAGDISLAHAGVVSRTMAALADQPDPVDPRTRVAAQALLLETAREVDPAQLGRAAQLMRVRLDPDAADRLARDEDAQERAQEAWLAQDATGMWQFGGRLASLQGATLKTALDVLSRPRPAADGTPDSRSGRRRTADALVALAELSLAAQAGQPGGLPSRGGSPARVILTAELEALAPRDGSGSGSGAASRPGPGCAVVHTGEPGGWPVSPVTVQTTICDAEIVPILTDRTGRPLDVGETIYPFPPRIRKAIELRDRHCSFPHCTAPPYYCHAHHLVPWGERHHGRTSEDNGTLLCGRHHRFVHARGWMGAMKDGVVVWRPPDRDERFTNVVSQDYERALRRLADQWRARARRPRPDTASRTASDPAFDPGRDSGRGRDPASDIVPDDSG